MFNDIRRMKYKLRIKRGANQRVRLYIVYAESILVAVHLI